MNKILYILLISTLSGGYFTDNFLKYSTIYGSGSISSPLQSSSELKFTGTDIEENITEIPYNYNLSLGIRKIARFKYEQKLKNFYDGSEKVGNENVTIGAVPGWEYLLRFSKLRNFGNEFTEEEYWLRYVGKWFVIRGQYSSYGAEGLTYAQLDLKHRKELGGFDFTSGISFRGRPIIIKPDIDWAENFENFWDLAYFMNFTDDWYWINEYYGIYDWYWWDPNGNLIASSDAEFYDNIFQGIVEDYYTSLIVNRGWQYEASLALGIDYYYYGDKLWLHAFGTILPFHYGITEFADVDGRGIDHDIGIIFGWKLNSHFGIFTEGRHLSYFGVGKEKNDHYELKAGLNYVIF
tara:strand:- start:122 stop:1171 length:1050 start_codon:yes stop_codon:yes gene_type:complete